MSIHLLTFSATGSMDSVASTIHRSHSTAVWPKPIRIRVSQDRTPLAQIPFEGIYTGLYRLVEEIIALNPQPIGSM